MSNEQTAVEQFPDAVEIEVSEEQVAAYLAENPDFFIDKEELLADLTLPHESGDAVSLLERQVTILREQRHSTRSQLSNLLENAHNNDQLFEFTRSLILSLLHAESITQLSESVRDALLRQENIHTFELILIHDCYNADEDTRIDSDLCEKFADVFRLEHTHCGTPEPDQLKYLFESAADEIKSTAICPIQMNGNQLGLLAIGSRQSNYFNVNLDTLFLDFIGNVVGVVLTRQFSR